MGLSERLSELDRELSALGEAPADLNERAGVQWARAATLSTIDEELEALSTGVSFVIATERRSSMLPPAPAPTDRPEAQPAIEAAAVESVVIDSVASDAAVIEAATTEAVSSSIAPSSIAAVDQAVASLVSSSIAPVHDAVVSQESASQESNEMRAPSVPAPASNDSAQPNVEAASVSQDAVFDQPAASTLDSDEPFVPTLPSEPPPEVETTVGLGSKRRVLTMSEPPPSEAPSAPSFAPPAADLDPFEGQPAPIPVPQRVPSVWPMAPAPKRTQTRSIRSAAPPPPPPLPSSRPRSLSPETPMKRPSDTPDPFAPVNRASSRPPTGLDADHLFGGISSTPPVGEAPKVSVPPALNVPKFTTATKTIQQAPPKPVVEAKNTDDDFELMVDDEMMEIDVEEMDELD